MSLTTPDDQKYLFEKKFLVVWKYAQMSLKKDIFERLAWLKTCFDAFANTSRHPEIFFQKRYFLPSEVVKDVF
jgi:hypothetical protein